MKLPIVVNWQWPLNLASKINGFTVCGLEYIPFISIVQKGCPNYDIMVNHEAIHFWQMMECLIIPWYLIYAGSYLFNRLYIGLNHKYAYQLVVFEQEAYGNQADLGYTKKRRWFAWLEYLGL